MTGGTQRAQPKENKQEGYQAGPEAPRTNQSASYAAEATGPFNFPPQVQAQGKTPGETRLDRMYVVESAPSPTGGMADHRFVLRSSEIEGWASDLAAALGVGGPVGTGKFKEVAVIAHDLQAHKGTCVVVAGDYQSPRVHALAHAMNQALGNAG